MKINEKTQVDWRAARREIPLGARPELVLVAIGHHAAGTRRYYDDFWCLHFYRYSAELTVDGQEFPIRPGHVSVVPPRVSNEYRSDVPLIHAVALFKLEEPKNAENTFSIATMQDLSGEKSEEFEKLYRGMEEAIEFFASQPLRAAVRVWDILWQLAESAPASHQSHLHPEVLKAIHLIELRLNRPIQVAALAREVGLSHDRLTKLFRASFGTTIVGYIRERRVQRAQSLLLNSTMPIKSIAAEVGLRDLHALNKSVRRLKGCSPRHVRRYSID